MRLAMVLMVVAGPVWADGPMMTDAFGIAGADEAGRADWAGYRETMAGVGAVVAPTAGAVVQIYLGPKTLVAGKDRALALALVTDAQGNLAAVGTPVTLTLAGVAQVADTRNGIATLGFGPLTRAGQFHAGAAIAGQQSARAEFGVTADLGSVVPVLAASDQPVLAEDFHDIATTALRDRFGNAVTEGSGLTLLLRGGDGSTTVLPAVTVGGIARTKLLARDSAPEGRLHASLAARTSAERPLRQTALRPLGEVAIDATALPDIAATSLRLGPFLTDAGHVLNDGAVVTVDLTTAKGATQRHTVWVLDGTVQVTALISAPDFPVTLRATSPLGAVTRTIAQPDLPQ